MEDWTDTNPHINRILAALQPMEELGGPEHKEYVAILNHIKDEIEGRIAMSTQHEADQKQELFPLSLVDNDLGNETDYCAAYQASWCKCRQVQNLGRCDCNKH
jgi:hypothetical protein